MSEELRAYTPEQLVAWRPPYIPWIIAHNLLVSQGTMLIYGDQETYKTMMAQDMGYKVSEGLTWFGFETKKTTVLYYQTELPQAMMRERWIKYQEGNRIDITTTRNFHICSEMYTTIDKGYGCTLFERMLDRINPGLIIIDPAMESFEGDLCDEVDVKHLTKRINLWRRDRKCSVVILHHAKKPETYQGEMFHYGPNSSYGHSKFTKNWPDSIIYVNKVRDDPATSRADLTLTFEKHRHSHTIINPIDVVVDRETLRIGLKGVI